jgi:hypothetical protein
MAATHEQKSRIQIWLYEQSDLRIEGQIIVSFSSCLSSMIGVIVVIGW